MYTEDIKALLEYAAMEILTLRGQSLIGQIKPVQVKNTLENLRSVLDYTAADLNSRIESKKSGASVQKVYFPYGQHENHFRISIKKNLPALNRFFPTIYTVIESIQPFKLQG